MARTAQTPSSRTAPRSRARATGGVDVRPVRSRRDAHRFVTLVWDDLYRGEPRWTPPLLSERKRRLSRRRNPFFAHAEAGCSSPGAATGPSDGSARTSTGA